MSCSVCWKEDKNNIKTPCNHVYCFDCLYKWVIINPNCPCCRRNFTEEEILHYYKNYSAEILSEAPLNKSHKKFGFEEPLKYFIPSIGISEIIPINETDTKFLIGAMGNEVVEQDLGLHYIKLNDQRNKITSHKYIPLNERVRDMIISKKNL